MASIEDTSVKYIHSEMMGAPVLAGVAGSLISVLDAFLVDGFGMKTVDSGVISNGVCRFGITGGSAVERCAVIVVSGATPAELNGEQRVTSFGSGFVEFKTELPDGPVSGSVAFKIAPLGWQKVFSKTNVAVYKPTDPTAAPFFLRVDDTGTTHARVTVYESMTDVDTGFNMVPNAATVSGGYYWWKRNSAGSSSAQYVLAGDGYSLIFAPMPTTAVGAAAVGAFVPYFAGQFNSYRSGDAYGVMLTGAVSNTNNAHGSLFAYATTAAYASLLRKSHGIGGASEAARMVVGAGADVSGTGAMPLGPINATVDNALRTGRILVADGDAMASAGVRGELPGALFCLNTGALSTFGGGKSLVEGNGDMQGRTLLSLAVGFDYATATGVGFVDITGPWKG